MIGRPSKLKWDPDYVPSIFEFKQRDEKAEQNNLARSHRLQKRRSFTSRAHKSLRKRRKTISAPANCGRSQPEVENSGEVSMNNSMVETMDTSVMMEGADQQLSESDVDVPSELHQPRKLSELTEDCLKCHIPSLVTIIHQQQQIIQQQQCTIDLLNDHKESVEKCLDQQKELTEMVKEELRIASVSLSPSLRMKDDDEQTHYYTGLPTYAAFTTLLTFFLLF